MSTFGEIVEPGSRNVWEDWDESSEHNFIELNWQQSIEVPKQIDLFLILEGKYLSDFVKSQSQNNLQLINSIPEVSLFLFKIKEFNQYVCTIKDYDVVQSTKIIELLKDYLMGSRDVVAVQTKPLPEYHTTIPAQDCVIRAVSTCHPTTLDISFPKLEQPNIVSGVSAGVICWRDHFELSGIAVVCYIEHPEDYNIEKIQKLLQNLNIVQTGKSQPSTILNSNLYI